MSKYEVTLDRRGTSVAPWRAKDVVVADSIQRLDNHISLLTEFGEVVATFPTDRVVSVVKLDVDPKDRAIAELEEKVVSLAKTSKSLEDENKRLLQLREPHITVWRHHHFGMGRDKIYETEPGLLGGLFGAVRLPYIYVRSGYTYEVK